MNRQIQQNMKNFHFKWAAADNLKWCDLTGLVHKRTSILTFEGLSTTFEASTNVYFIIKLNVIMVIYVLKLPAQCYLLITKQLGTHVQSLAI